jgi:hypothetical protein
MDPTVATVFCVDFAIQVRPRVALWPRVFVGQSISFM